MTTQTITTRRLFLKVDFELGIDEVEMEGGRKRRQSWLCCFDESTPCLEWEDPI